MDDSSTDSSIVSMEDSSSDSDDDIEDILLSEIGSTDPAHPSTFLQSNAVETRGRPRNARTVVRLPREHAQALHCINRDFLGPSPLYGSDFRTQFRISMSTFEYIMQEVMRSDIRFYR
eukprot:CAMPEP_0113462266 /NCGR_PEP_ID=MMETSP0014_2-20120614/11993_1 /TAXON_ID=2857 /ORGANISM="Nitzschia sp." /LENGTH=117 /DNA_ID=CAMNT_0000354103 /DNA_START=407 /DNA_END=756 /DNA_ORIENTATION=+ /assembly_acc=CAM_ASM_000159